MRKNMKTIIVAIMLQLANVNESQAITYVEHYETAPGGTGYAAILRSPNGLAYDFYDDRAFARLAGIPNLTVLPPGDEAFYWGNNEILPSPKYGEDRYKYSDDNISSGYLFNGYGTGSKINPADPFVLGIDFTNGATTVNSLDITYAGGSNAPTHRVQVIGYNGGLEIWDQQANVIFGTISTIDLPEDAVDRIEISRDINITPLFNSIPVGWYVMDNLSYEIPSIPSGDYEWNYYTKQEYLDPFSPIPEPNSVALISIGLIRLLSARKKIMIKNIQTL